ncbi:hypothetical protein HYS94_01785 [Candidatus Daviesbacteria bacterium]|nr:hypothetical protein [Candidatus Daviesbacteria bacterium]
MDKENLFEVEDLISYIELACGALRYAQMQSNQALWESILDDIIGSANQLQEAGLEERE